MGMKAVDVANYTAVPTPAQVQCLIADGYTTAIVGCSYGQVARSQLMAFSDNGMKIEAYAWITHPLNTLLLERALTVIAGLPVTRLWLDAEADTNGRTPAGVVADINGAVEYCQKVRPDLALGIYTGAWWWTPRTGNSQETWGLPLWLANYRDTDNPLAESEIPGGWTRESTAIWQYAGTIETCGLNTDRNLILEEDEMTPAQMAELKAYMDMKFIQLIGWVNDQKFVKQADLKDK